ncbi:cation diffusion facilitator family transporter [bacterium]|nr:cation diffusion facilitator family transporter [bacterium]
MDHASRKSSVALLSVVSNTILVIMKLAIGLLIGSVSVISEAIHSGVDLLAALIAFFAVKSSGQPADKEHPFGHGKIENISGTIEALLIFLAAGWIIWEAVHKLLHPQPLESVGWGVGVMLISALANMFVSHMLFKVGRQTDSVALKADAWHLRTDVYTSAGVMAGLGLIWLAEAVFPGEHFHWIDPVAAMAVALLIIRAAYELTVKSGRDLLDVSLPDDEERWIVDYLSQIDTVKGFHHLRTRKAGSERFVEFHLLVDPNMSVEQSHQIADEITQGIRERFIGTAVTIHIEPCDGRCGPDCAQSTECSHRISSD